MKQRIRGTRSTPCSRYTTTVGKGSDRITCHAGIEEPNPGSEPQRASLGLPSLVPDWRVDKPGLGRPNTRFASLSARALSATISDDHKTLTTTAKVIRGVCAVGTPLGKSYLETPKRQILSNWLGLAKSNCPEPYRTDTPVLQAFFRTLIDDPLNSAWGRNPEPVPAAVIDLAVDFLLLFQPRPQERVAHRRPEPDTETALLPAARFWPSRLAGSIYAWTGQPITSPESPGKSNDGFDSLNDLPREAVESSERKSLYPFTGGPESEFDKLWWKNKDRVEDSDAKRLSFLAEWRKRSQDKTSVATDQGDMGIAPRQTQTGDILCMVSGCERPLVLRHANPGGYFLVGPAYVHGFMTSTMSVIPDRHTRPRFETIVLP